MTRLKVQQTSRIASTVKRDWTAAAKSLAALLGVQGPLECLLVKGANWSFRAEAEVAICRKRGPRVASEFYFRRLSGLAGDERMG
jgi:hypothetical protein